MNLIGGTLICVLFFTEYLRFLKIRKYMNRFDDEGKRLSEMVGRSKVEPDVIANSAGQPGLPQLEGSSVAPLLSFAHIET